MIFSIYISETITRLTSPCITTLNNRQGNVLGDNGIKPLYGLATY